MSCVGYTLSDLGLNSELARSAIIKCWAQLIMNTLAHSERLSAKKTSDGYVRGAFEKFLKSIGPMLD